MNNPKYFVKDLGKYKTLVVNKQTGKETLIIKDQQYREAVKRGDFLQPFGDTKRQFFDKNPQYKENEKGELVNTEIKYFKEREQGESLEAEKEQEDFKKRMQDYDKKFY